MWLIGVVLLVLGWVGDSHGFWSDRPFMTNLVSSVTGAIFGIPFVLVIIQQIATAQAERVEARAAQRLAARVSREMLNAARNMVQDSPGAMTALTELAAREQQERLNPDEEGRAWAEMIKRRDAFVPAINDLWARWDYLRSAVRDRVLTTDGRWINSGDATNLDRSRSGNDWTSLSGDNYQPDAGNTILDVIRTTHTIAEQLNAGDPLDLKSFNRGPIPRLKDMRDPVVIHPDI
jgi:hypothetical protein